MAAKDGGIIITSVLISLCVGGAGMYFAAPYMFPNVTRSPTGVIQMKNLQTTDDSYLLDTATNKTMMNNTQLNINTSGGTSLFVEFNTVLEVIY